MAITPQAIKDQEFQTKFRGYDPIEVKAYLDLVAEEFFELLERLRQRDDEFEDVVQEKVLLEELKENLEADIESALRTAEELRRESAAKDETRSEIAKEIEELQTAVADLEQEKREYDEEISAAEGRVAEVREELQKSRAEQEMLRSKIMLLEEQNRELKNGEVDFKRTIGAAQRFADELRQSAQSEAEELKQSSESRARELLRKSDEKATAALQIARDEIERLRREAYAELSRLPEEIERLNQQRKQVREDLRSSLSGYLERLNSFAEVDEKVRHYDYDELFQKIDISDETVGQLDDLDGISMELPLIEERETGDDHEERDDLRRKLEQGGVAYLSDSDN